MSHPIVTSKSLNDLRALGVTCSYVKLGKGEIPTLQCIRDTNFGACLEDLLEKIELIKRKMRIEDPNTSVGVCEASSFHKRGGPYIIKAYPITIDNRTISGLQAHGNPPTEHSSYQ